MTRAKKAKRMRRQQAPPPKPARQLPRGLLLLAALGVAGASVVAAVATGVACFATAACGAAESVPGSVAALCASAIEHDGHNYMGNAAKVRPIEARPLGEGLVPACGDIAGGPEGPTQRIEVAEIQGVDPEVAIMRSDQPDTIFIRDDVDHDQLPGPLVQLLRAPRCDPDDEPIELAGPWHSILGADGHTELDLEPPYDVSLYAERSSAARYERAFLTVRVPAKLGRPLDRSDVETSLWETGTITVRARCHRGRFIAQHVAADPPR